MVVTGWANTVRGADSAKGVAKPVLSPITRLTVASATFKARDLRIQGTSNGPTNSLVQARTARSWPGHSRGDVAAPAAPATTGAWDARNRTITTNPGQIWVTTVGGGVIGPVTVTNR